MSRWTDEQISEGREQSAWNEGYRFGQREPFLSDSEEEETVNAIVRLCGEYEPAEFAGGGCPSLRAGLLEIVRKLNHRNHEPETVNGFSD